MHLNAALRNAGLWILLSLASGHLTEQQASNIVDIHNDLRSQVLPSAAFMQKLVWNETVRLVAESYAAKCIFKDNPDLQNLKLGENLYVPDKSLNITNALLDWFEENRNYDFENNICRGTCHDYTQMVRANSTQIGCASHFCETIEGLDRNGTLLVCNYYPSENNKRQRPYEQGESCSKCPDDLQSCEAHICVKRLQSESTTVTEEDTTKDTKKQKCTTSRSEVERSSAPLLMGVWILAALIL